MSEPLMIDVSPQDRRLYDRLRARIVSLAPGYADGAETGDVRGRPRPSGMSDIILLLPDLAVLLARLLRDSRVSIIQKGIAIAGVAYVLSPIDVLPTVVFGPIGALDDVFIVAACLSRILNHVHPDVVRSHWSGQGDALEVVQDVTSWFERSLALRVSDVTQGLRRRGP